MLKRRLSRRTGIRALWRKIQRASPQLWYDPVGYDPLARRAALHARIRECVRGGYITLCCDYTDCDGFSGSYERRYHAAAPRRIEAIMGHAYQWADGPMSFHIAEPKVEDNE